MNAQFQNRFWRQDGCTGQCFGTSNPMTGTPLFTGPETVYQNTWNVTLAQPGATGIMVNYSGGDYSRDNFLTTSNPANFDLSTFRGRRMRNTYIQNAMTQFLVALKGTLASTPTTFFYTYDQNGNINNVDINHWAEVLGKGVRIHFGKLVNMQQAKQQQIATAMQSRLMTL